MTEPVLITLAVTARNEERSIAATLRSLVRAVTFAEGQGRIMVRLVVILDDCTDNTQNIVGREFPQVDILIASGGLVEAQRLVAHERPFVIFCDADVLVDECAVAAISHAMLDDPALQVAYAAKSPLPPDRRTLMAAALYCYNRVNGFQTARRYFSGKFFAIRDWQVPTLAELHPRLQFLPQDPFYDYHAGLRVDDIWLSRDILKRHGDLAIREIEAAHIRYHPPETFTGMYRMYLRMTREIERLNVMFPETIPVHQQRGYDRAAERAAPWRDRLLWRVFRIALSVCRLLYKAERYYYQNIATVPLDAWRPVEETKVLSSS